MSAKLGAIPLDPAAEPTAGPYPPTKSPPTPQGDDDGQSKSQGLGALIFGTLGKTDPQASGSADPVNIIQVPRSSIKKVTVAGQVLSINPSGIVVDGSSYSVGGQGLSLPGGVVSLVPIFKGEEAPANANSLVRIPVPESGVKEVLSISPSGVVLDGSSYSVGGPPLSLPGGVVSLVPTSEGEEAPRNENSIVPVPVPASGVEEITFGGQVLSISPSGVVLDGTSYFVGGPAIILQGAGISLMPNSAMEETSNKDNTAKENEALASVTRIITGQTVVSTPSGLVIGGSSLLPRGNPITISNTVISLSPSNDLIVGSSSVSLAPQSLSAVGHFLSSPSSAGFVIGDSNNIVSVGEPPITIDGMAIHIESSAVLVDGITLQPGGKGTLVDGMSVSLEQDGTLNIGSTTFATPTGLVTQNSILQAFEGS